MPVRRAKNLPDGRTVLSATLGLARGAPPVSEKDSSVGALALSPEDGFARRLPQNDTDHRHAVFSRIRYYAIILRTSSVMRGRIWNRSPTMP